MVMEYVVPQHKLGKGLSRKIQKQARMILE